MNKVSRIKKKKDEEAWNGEWERKLKAADREMQGKERRQSQKLKMTRVWGELLKIADLSKHTLSCCYTWA